MPEPVGSAQRYMPGLDGLRAIAVLAVIAYHLKLSWAQGGLLGVGVFFTLSGYLITDLLLGQQDAAGHLRLGNFWLRRARRLLPALFLMLAVVVVWVTLLDPSRLPDLRGDVAAAAVYMSNWWNIIRQASYFARFGPPPPLDHLWSLAVEEQFYLVWPWLLWLGLRYVRGRYLMAVLTVAVAALSAIAMATLYQPGVDPTRVYEGTDTRAFGLLLGAALAMVWPSRRLGADLLSPQRRQRRRERTLGRLLDGVGIVGLVVIALLVWQTNQYSAFLYHGGIVLLSVATVLVVAAVAHPATRLGLALGWKPLRWLGVRSYGIYLWHWPIIVLTTPILQKEINYSLATLQVGATIVVAALSWRFVEEPIRRGALGRLWAQVLSAEWREKSVPPGIVLQFKSVPPQSILQRSYGHIRWFLAGLVSVLVLGVLILDGAGLAGVTKTGGGDLAGAIGTGGGGLQPAGKGPSDVKISMHHTTASRPATTLVSSSRSPKAASEATNQTTTMTTTPSPTQKSAPAPRTSCRAVAYMGDSTSEGMVLHNYLPNPSQRLDAQLSRVGVKSQYFEIRGATSIVETLPGQSNGVETAKKLKAKGFHGCWVIAYGTNDTADVYVGSQVGLKDRIDKMMSLIGDQPVMWVTVKSLLSSGPYSEANMQDWNRALVQACDRYPNMRVFDWASLVKDDWFISDGTHYTSEGYKHRASLTTSALVHAFPGKGKSSGCVVR